MKPKCTGLCFMLLAAAIYSQANGNNCNNCTYIGCTTLGTDCLCWTQSDDVCSNAIANAECNYDTGACQCGGSFVEQNGSCISDQNSVVNSGDSISPLFSPPANPNDWLVVTGADAENKTERILHNNHYLSTGSDVSVTCSVLLKANILAIEIFFQ